MKKEHIKSSFKAKGESGCLITKMWRGQEHLFFRHKNGHDYRFALNDCKITIDDDFAVLRTFANGEATLDYNDKLLGLSGRLRSYILNYRKLQDEFNNCRDLYHSNPKLISNESRELSKKFFHFKEFLSRSIDDFPEDKEYEAAVKWRGLHLLADICPNLVQNGQIERAAKIMADLGKAEQEMFQICEENNVEN